MSCFMVDRMRGNGFGSLLAASFPSFQAPKQSKAMPKKTAITHNRVKSTRDMNSIAVPTDMPTVSFKKGESIASVGVIREPTNILVKQKGRMKHNPDNIKGVPKQMKHIKVVDENNKFISEDAAKILKAEDRYTVRYESAVDNAALQGISAMPKRPPQKSGGMHSRGGGSEPVHVVEGGSLPEYRPPPYVAPSHEGEEPSPPHSFYMGSEATSPNSTTPLTNAVYGLSERYSREYSLRDPYTRHLMALAVSHGFEEPRLNKDNYTQAIKGFLHRNNIPIPQPPPAHPHGTKGRPPRRFTDDEDLPPVRHRSAGPSSQGKV